MNSILLIILLCYLLVLIVFGLHFLKKSNRRARHLLESIDDFFIAFDNKWRFSYVNAKACQSLGFSKKELLGKYLHDIYPGFENTPTFRQYLLAKRINKPLTFPMEGFGGKDYNARVFPTKEGLSVYLSDISRIKQYERQLQESELRFKTIADCAPVMIWLAGPDMRRYYFNLKWLQFRGKRWQDEIGEGWLSGIHPDDIEQFKELYAISGEARIEFEMEYRLLRSDGQYRWMLSRCVPRYDKAGKYLGYAGTVLDITDRKEVEERKDEFLSIASHELKTPVTTIKAFTQLLLQKHQKDQDSLTYDYLKRVDVQVNNLTGLIKNLLDVSVIEQGAIQFKKQNIQVSDLIRDVVSDMQSLNKNIDLIIESNDRSYINADPERLRQVLTNLIDNGIRYSPGQNKIIIHSKTNKHTVVISVQDFGLGIPKEKQTKIFDRFFRVNGPMSETFGGLGLGLYISAEIIKRHGGRLWVKSSENQGSTFYFSLPIVKNDHLQDDFYLSNNLSV